MTDEDEAPPERAGLQDNDQQRVASVPAAARKQAALMLATRAPLVIGHTAGIDGRCICGRANCKRLASGQIEEGSTRDPFMLARWWNKNPQAEVCISLGTGQWRPLPGATPQLIESLFGEIKDSDAPFGLVYPIEASALRPLDWPYLLDVGLPETAYLKAPYIAAGIKIMSWGKAESGKSIFWLHEGAYLSRRRYRVVLFSLENPLSVELQRIAAVKPDHRYFRVFHQPDLDLRFPPDLDDFLSACDGAALIIIDSLSSLWGGDEDKSKDFIEFDKKVWTPITQNGATCVVIDHVGHPQAFVDRSGAHKGRGTSAKGQKVDSILEFRSAGDRRFSIRHTKNRVPPGIKEPDRTFEIFDTKDGRIEIRPAGSADVSTAFGHYNAKVDEVADAMVEVIRREGSIPSRKLRQHVKGLAGSRTQTEAMEKLQHEQPPRVIVSEEHVVTAKGGRQRANLWRPARPQESEK